MEIWRQLPQTVLSSKGQLIYNYDFTKKDVRLFLNATFPLDQLTAIDTDEWVARVVVVPGDFWASGRVDNNITYSELLEMLEIENISYQGKITVRRPVTGIDQ
jgi:hypothetical protein